MRVKLLLTGGSLLAVAAVALGWLCIRSQSHYEAIQYGRTTNNERTEFAVEHQRGLLYLIRWQTSPRGLTEGLQFVSYEAERDHPVLEMILYRGFYFGGFGWYHGLAVLVIVLPLWLPGIISAGLAAVCLRRWNRLRRIPTGRGFPVVNPVDPQDAQARVRN